MRLAYLRPYFLGPHEVGHKDVATGSGVLSLWSYTRKLSFKICGIRRRL